VVQQMLSHSSIVLTADTYTSVLPDAAHAAAEEVAAPAAWCPAPADSGGARPGELPSGRARTPDAVSPGRPGDRGRIRPGRSAARTAGTAPACDDQCPQVTEPHAGHGTCVAIPDTRKLTEDTRTGEQAQAAGYRPARTQRMPLPGRARPGEQKFQTARGPVKIAALSSSRPHDGLRPAPRKIIIYARRE
jgi:hypothetical protein